MHLIQQNAYWMKKALALAREAFNQDEVPVGAVLVKNNCVLAAAHNATINHHDLTAHAEMLVLKKASRGVNMYQLQDATLYVTLEPCMMCLGALIQTKIQRVVFGAYDSNPHTINAMHVVEQFSLKKALSIIGGLYEKESCYLLKQFFRKKRVVCFSKVNSHDHMLRKIPL